MNRSGQTRHAHGHGHGHGRNTTSKTLFQDPPSTKNAENDFILMTDKESDVFGPVLSFLAFVFTCCLLPFVFCIYIGVYICRHMWLNHLQKKFPYLEFIKRTSLRTAMDTIRNQGVVTVLLQVKGKCDVTLFRQRIREEILEKRQSDGKLCFPHLTCKLTSKYGRYAWDSCYNFNIEKHIFANTAQYKGRVVSDDNIQEYVSDIVSKYLPRGIPPWQIIIIPVTTNEIERNYILIRIHHLFLSEDNIKLGHLLMVQKTTKEDDVWQRSDPEGCSDISDDSFQSMLGTIKPRALTQLYEHFCGVLSNAWNELIYQYDPLENPCVLKSPTMFNFFILCLILGVYVLKTYYTRSCKETISSIARKELKRRKVNGKFLQRCVLNTLNPVNAVLRSIYITWYFYTFFLFRVPLFLLGLLRDFNTYIYLGGLAIGSLKEFLGILGIVYRIPRVLMEEMVYSILNEKLNQLQTVSLCGRKVVNWSNSVHASVLQEIQHNTNALPSEIFAYALAASAQQYFNQNNLFLPKKLHSTVRFISQEDLMKVNKRLSDGILCFDLPLRFPANDPLFSLNLIQHALHQTLIRQAPVYLASSLRCDLNILTHILPSVVVRFLLYLLTRHYSVTITQVEGNLKEAKKSKLLWGQEIESIMYWRPPQANISVSLTLMCYGDEVRLGMMADAELVPDHMIILREFPNKIQQLATAAAELRQKYSSSMSSLDLSIGSDSSLHLDFSD